MKRSQERILTTHVGSLPRPQYVVDQLFAQDRGEAYDEAEFDAVMTRAVREVAFRQVDAGVDIVSDGEMSKISYATYMRHRLTGFEIAEVPRATPKDLDDFPAFKERLAQQGGTPQYHRPVVRGDIRIKDLAPLEKRHRQPARGRRSRRRQRSLHERGFPWGHRRLPTQRALHQRGILLGGAGGCDEGGIRAHHRGRPVAAGRLP